ncbi:MAG: tetratricopeptide repeat-containing sensor histidine kinase [Polaribacter sp.]
MGQNKEDIIKLHKEFNQIRFVNFDKATQNARKAVIFSEKIADKTLLLNSYKNLSEILYLKKENDSAYTYNQKAISLALELNKENQLAQLYNVLGAIERGKNNFTQSLKHHEKALALADKTSKEEIPKIKNNLARLYWATDKEQYAKKILQEVIEKDKSIYKDDIADAYNILGKNYLHRNNDSSLVFYKKAYSFIRTSNHQYLKGIVTSNLGYVYILLKEYKKGFQYLKKSEEICTQVDDKSTLHHINISLGIYYQNQKDLKNALKKYKKGIEEYGSFVGDYQRKEAFLTAHGAFYYAGEYKDAFLYLDEYTVLNEKISNLEKEKEFEKIRTEYEVEKKENKITLLEKENELAAIQRKSTSIIFVSVVIIFILLLIFYINRVKNQKKIRTQEKKIHKNEKEKLEKENELKKIQGYVEGQEKEKNRIAIELHDGIAGGLAGVKHLLSTVNDNNETPKIEKATHHIGVLTKNVRSLSHHLSSNYITNNPFTSLLTDLKNNYNSSHQFEIEITFFPNDYFYNLESKYKHHLYRITQELLHNIIKHAQAKNVSISFVKHKEYFSFIVEDDGVGFSYKEDGIGIGLTNIKERVLLLNGNMNIDSIPNKGTTVSIEIPSV